MSQPGFLNVNSNRAFPFLHGTVGSQVAGPAALVRLPDAAVVDCGFVMGEACGFVDATHSVFLYRVTRAGTTFTLEFGTDAPLLAGSYLAFERELGGDEYLIEYVDSAETHTESTSDEACDEPLWSGYVVSGKIDSLATLLPSDGVLTRAAGEAVVEPALVQNLSGTYVTSFGFANDDRTRATPPDGCPDYTWPHPVGVLFVNARCVQGDLLLKPGFNASLRQDAVANSVVLGASVGAGEGRPCVEVRLFPDESVQDDGTLLEGGPSCHEVLRSFNGVGGPEFDFVGNLGVSVEAVPAENKVVIDVSMVGMAICAAEGSVVSVSEVL